VHSGSGHRTPILVQMEDGQEPVEWFGRRAQVSLKSHCWLSAGKYKGIYSPIPYVRPRGCKHHVTVCDECMDTWCIDYAVLVFPYHGDLGYNQGCRCEQCIIGRKKWLPPRQYLTARRINIRWRMLDRHPDLDANRYNLADVCESCLAQWPNWCGAHAPEEDK
jgi:hypothetical protein